MVPFHIYKSDTHEWTRITRYQSFSLQYITNVLMFVAGLMLMILGAIMVSREYWSFFIPKTVIHVYLINALLQIGASLMGLRGTYKATEKHRYTNICVCFSPINLNAASLCALIHDIPFFHSRRSRQYTMLMYVLMLLGIFSIQLYIVSGMYENTQEHQNLCPTFNEYEKVHLLHARSFLYLNDVHRIRHSPRVFCCGSFESKLYAQIILNPSAWSTAETVQGCFGLQVPARCHTNCHRSV
jgi:hypothetical protein